MHLRDWPHQAPVMTISVQLCIFHDRQITNGIQMNLVAATNVCTRYKPHIQGRAQIILVAPEDHRKKTATKMQQNCHMLDTKSSSK